MQDDIKTLYSLIKGFISKKEANQNKQKVPSENSGIIAGNKHSLENSSYISFPTLKDNDLDGKELYENLPTLVHQQIEKIIPIGYNNMILLILQELYITIQKV